MVKIIIKDDSDDSRELFKARLLLSSTYKLILDKLLLYMQAIIA
jgi:hypothetical protein